MKNKDQIILEQLYSKVVINEISSKFVDEVKDAVSDGELPFNNIFEDKLRIKIPMGGTSEEYKTVLSQISKIKNFDHFDPESKEVVKKIEVDPKYGGGVKYQKINLGKAISSLGIPEDEKKKLLDWFALHSSDMGEMEKGGKYTIVLSRSPIDILRMSDIGTIHSCHSEGGAYFDCAIQEAKSGGPIAYVVKTEDLQNLSDDDFQNEEIFKDTKRGISGITAISRIRIRRYQSTENDDNIAIPDTKIYGSNVEGFYKTLKDFLKEKQFNDVDINDLYRSYKNKAFTRRGGHYQDYGVDDAHIFNHMFDTQIFRNSLPFENSDGVSREAEMENELVEINRRWNNFKYCGASYDMGDYEEEQAYYSAYGHINIDLSDIELTDDILDLNINEKYDINNILRYNPQGKNNWEKHLPYGMDHEYGIKLQKFLKKFVSYDTSRFADNDMSGIHINNNMVGMYICFGDDCNSISNDTGDYEIFLRKIADYDDEYEVIKKAFIKALYSAGFVEMKESDKNLIDKVFESDEDLGESLKNLTYYDSSDSYDIIGKPLIILDDNVIETFDTNKKNDLEKDFSKFLEKFIQNYFKPEQKENKDQMTFKGFLESYETPILKKYGISFELSMGREGAYYQNDKTKALLTGNLAFKISYLNNLTAQLIQFLDNNMEDLVNVMKLLGLRMYGLENDYSKNLERVYGKFII